MQRRFILLLTVLFTFVLAQTAFAYSEDGRFERTLKVTGMPQVEVHTGSGNISVHSGDSSSIRVIGHIHMGHGWFGGGSLDNVKRIEANPPIEQVGNLVKIGRINDAALRRNISIDFEVWVPEQTTLRADSGSGDVMVENLKNMVKANTGSGNVTVSHVQGEVRADTGSGDVQVLDVTGNVTADTGSGNVKASMSGNGTLRLETGSGDITAQNVRGGLHARTGSGNVTADGDVVADWMVETGSGDVRIRVPQSAKFEIAASTGSGDLHVNREITMSGNVDKHRIRGKVNGGGPLMQLETSSGNVVVQ